MTMPQQNKHASKQTYGTPIEFIKAIESFQHRKFEVDLAASSENAKAPIFITEAENSLEQDWKKYASNMCWLNPPFAKITPWAKKCSQHAAYFRIYGGGLIFFLTPASIGSRWYADYVHNYAATFGIIGRLTFEGEKTPYPKDCILSVFGASEPGFGLWDWRRDNGFHPYEFYDNQLKCRSHLGSAVKYGSEEPTY